MLSVHTSTIRFLKNLDVTSLNTNFTSTSENCKEIKINKKITQGKIKWIQNNGQLRGQGIACTSMINQVVPRTKEDSILARIHKNKFRKNIMSIASKYWPIDAQNGKRKTYEHLFATILGSGETERLKSLGRR